MREIILGQTLLHHIASSTSEQAIEFASALIEHPLIDLYLQDYENGWTALHRAFYFGNVTIARLILERDAGNALGRFTGQVSSDSRYHKDQRQGGPWTTRSLRRHHQRPHSTT